MKPLFALLTALVWAGSATAAVLPEASGKPVVILGEVHDNPLHHAIQAQVITEIAPTAVVFEMLTSDQAALATIPARADPDHLGALLGWEAAGWPPFAMYAPIFTNAGTARIYGAAVPSDVAQRAFDAGAAAVFGTDAARFGLTDPLDPADQAAREAEQAAAHCGALPPDLLPGFVAAQRLRDAELARVILLALSETGGPVAVITGNGHARRDTGIPAVLEKAAPGVAVFSLGMFEEPDDPPPDDARFDRRIVTAPTPRPDPCAAFE